MASEEDAARFSATLDRLASPGLADLATRLASVRGLEPDEARVVLAAAGDALDATLHRKLSRVLILELNAARVEGRLQGETPQARWEHFLALASAEGFWDDLSVHYPSLRGRVDRLVGNHVAAAAAFAERWAADRADLAALLGGDAGAIAAVNFGAGDSHRGGHTVAIVTCEGGRVVYKPRSLAPEAALAGFVAGLRGELDRPAPLRVPAVVGFEDYGWAEFVPHRYAAGREELRSFYEGVGQWLAIMRLLGGADLHAENLIAHGPSPVLIDCETLFTPKSPPFPSGFGDAADRAAELLSGSVLAAGLLPGRGQALGWRGVDMSGVGGLRDQQPVMVLPDIVGAGTDEAKIGVRAVEISPLQNHPSPEPELSAYWPHVLDGFEQASAALRRLDARGDLGGRLAGFEHCRIRAVLRATEAYAELARMLWHPASLHKEDAARGRAHELLTRMAANLPGAPGDPAVIEAEIDELMVGDIPYFSAIARKGVLEGPSGVCWPSPRNLVAEALQSWREADLELERTYVRAALVSAYVNDGWMPDDRSLWPREVREGDLDARRRRQAAAIMTRLVASAVRGRDGTVTWIAPALTASGWAVQPMEWDLYSGLSGIAVLTGAYLREEAADRADPVEGLDDLFAALLRTLETFEAKHAAGLLKDVRVRPPAPGGYLGLGSQIWSLLALDRWGVRDGVHRAERLARDIPRAAADDETNDVLTGRAGAIPPLLALARATGDDTFVGMAGELGDELCERATRRNGYACWTSSSWPEGIGGFAHGATGVGWALTQLARATGEARHRETAQAAFAFEDTLFDEEEQGWIDLRRLGPKTASAWCHGAVGIALARLDLDPDLADPDTRLTLRRAAAATWRLGRGWNHCACHGDLGAWELFDRAISHGEAPDGLTHDALLASILTSLEDNGPVCGLLRDAVVPGLLPGLGGVAYQLLRAHPDSRLPSILTLAEARP